MLTEKQARFVAEYLVDLNATQAAIRAGYSAKTASSIAEENLRKPEIAAAVQEAMDARAARTTITQDRVLRELARIGFADMRKLLKWTGNRTVMDLEEAEETEAVDIRVSNLVTLYDSDELDADTVAAISEISQTKEGALKVKLHDKQAALVNIGKHLGMFTDRVQLDAKHTHSAEPASLPEVFGWLEEACRASGERPN